MTRNVRFAGSRESPARGAPTQAGATRAGDADGGARADSGARKAPFVLLVVGLLVAGLWALLALNTAAAANEVQARRLTADNADSLDEVEQLRIDIAGKLAPGWLGSAAARLGLVPDSNPLFLSVQSNGAVVVLGTPKAVVAAPAPMPSPVSTPTPVVALPPGAAAPGVPGSTSTPTPTPTPTPTAGATATPAVPAAAPAAPVSTASLPGGAR
jgi:hypothetical protein